MDERSQVHSAPRQEGSGMMDDTQQPRKYRNISGLTIRKIDFIKTDMKKTTFSRGVN